MRKTKNVLILIYVFIITSTSLLSMVFVPTAHAQALPLNDFAMSQCGTGSEKVITAINFDCKGAQCYNQYTAKNITPPPNSFCGSPHSAVVDILFAIIRFLSDGIGLILIASLIIAGIQYTTSQGDPGQLKKASERIRGTATALILFIFAYALLNYIIPNGFFG